MSVACLCWRRRDAQACVAADTRARTGRAAEHGPHGSFLAKTADLDFTRKRTVLPGREETRRRKQSIMVQISRTPHTVCPHAPAPHRSEFGLACGNAAEPVAVPVIGASKLNETALALGES